MTHNIGQVVAGVVALVLALAGAVTTLAIDGGPASVAAVADAAVDAAEDLDIGDGADLMCDSPTKRQRDEVAQLISEAQQDSGTDDPDVDYDISNVDGHTEGSFDVRITSDELDNAELEYTVLVDRRDGRSCIAGIENLN